MGIASNSLWRWAAQRRACAACVSPSELCPGWPSASVFVAQGSSFLQYETAERPCEPRPFDHEVRPPSQCVHFLGVQKRLLERMQPQERKTEASEPGADILTDRFRHVAHQVVHQGIAISLENPMRLGQCVDGFLPVVERPCRDHAIECPIGERQGIRAGNPHFDSGVPPACLHIPLSLRNHRGRNVNADQLRIRKYLPHRQQQLSRSGADVEYAPRSSVMGYVMGHQLVMPKEDLAAAQGVVEDTPRPGDPFGMKPLQELSPTTAHIVQANVRRVSQSTINSFAPTAV